MGLWLALSMCGAIGVSDWNPMSNTEFRVRPIRAVAGRGAPVLAAILALVLSGCGRAPPAYAPPPPPEVTVAHPVQRDIPDTLEFVATIRGAREVQIRSRVSGFLEHKHTDGGVRVSAGEDLFTLDLRPFNIAVEEAQAVVTQRQSELSEAETKLKAEQDAIARGGSNERALSEALAARDVAVALVALAEAQADRVRLELEWANIQAPIGGRMSFAQAEEGDLISVNQLLASIVDDTTVYAVYDIDERTLLSLREKYDNLRPGEDGRPILPVALQRANDRGFPIQGTFYRAESGVNPDTGTIRVEAEFANPDGAILPGTFVRVQPNFGDRPALLVPDVAVLSDQGGRYVLAVDQDNIAHRIPVNITGPIYERMRPVEEATGQDLANGLNGAGTPRLDTNARVIVNGLQRVRAGMEVDPAFEGERRSQDDPPPGGAPGH